MTTEDSIITLLHARKSGTWEDLSMWLSIAPEKIKPIITAMLRGRRIHRTDRKVDLRGGGEGYMLVVKKEEKGNKEGMLL